MAVGDIYRSTLEGRLHGQAVLNVLHHHQSVDEADGDSATLAGRLSTTLVPLLKALLSFEWSFVRVVSQKIRPLPPLVPSINAAGVGVGGIADQSLPTSVAIVITLRTAFAGRAFRGRLFVGGIPVSSESDSQLTPAQFAGWQAFASQLTQTVVGGAGSEWQPIVYHRATFTFDRVLTAEPRSIMRNQRRRQIGKGV